MCRYEDLERYRTEVLGKKEPYPLQVIVTRKAVDFSHILFQKPGLSVLIVCTETLYPAIMQNLQATPVKSTVTVKSFGHDSVDWSALFTALKHDHHCPHIDISAGSNVISQLLSLEQIHEIRQTLTGQICGALNSRGQARPHLYQSLASYPSPHGNPWLRWRSIRTVGELLLFVRAQVDYRRPMGSQ